MFNTPSHKKPEHQVDTIENNIKDPRQSASSLDKNHISSNSNENATHMGIDTVPNAKFQHQLGSIVENSSEFIGIISLEGQILYINKAGLNLAGLISEKQALSTPICDFFSQNHPFLLTEEVIPSVRAKGSWSGENYIQHFKTKEEVPISISAFAVDFPESKGQMCLGLIIRNIIGQKRTEASLIKERDRAQMYLDTAGVMLIALDSKGNINLINKKGCEILGYDESEILGKNWFSHFIPGDQMGAVKQTYAQLMKGKIDITEYAENSIVKKNGETREIAWHNRILKDERGDIIGIFSSGEDITHLKHAEKEKEELQIQLIKTQKMEAIGVLAGGIAHDFNNILSPILGYTEMMLESLPKDNPWKTSLIEIMKAAKRARNLVKQILSFGNQANQEVKPVDLKHILNEVVTLIRSSFPSTIQVHKHLSSNCGLVMADPTQIHQIAMNLITNAYHAMEKNGGRLEIKLTKVETESNSLKNPSQYVCLTVSDTGVGMKKHITDRIFEPYFTTKTKNKGTGLGLSVVHGIIKSYGGDIQVHSEPGKGTTFKVFLPIITSVGERHEKNIQAGLKRGNERILLVDDEDQIIRMAYQWLMYLGYHVTTRTNSKEAFELFSKAPYGFDIVITDMTMPQMTGIELSKKILSVRGNIPIIICTGFNEQISEEKARRIGIRGFLLKPILFRELSELIRNILDSNNNGELKMNL